MHVSYGEGISIAAPGLLCLGQEVAFTLEANGEFAEDAPYGISIEGTAAALGSGENTLIGAAAGQATLVVTRVDMSGVTHRAEHALTVLEASEITLNLSQTEAELAAGETLLLTAETVPEGLRVTWASTNAEVLSVQDGLVQALQSGELHRRYGGGHGHLGLLRRPRISPVGHLRSHV